MIIKSTLIRSLARFKSDLMQLLATKTQVAGLEARLENLEAYATDQDIIDLFSAPSAAFDPATNTIALNGASYDAGSNTIALTGASYASNTITMR